MIFERHRECLQCVKDPTNEVDKNAFAVFFTNSHYIEDVFWHLQQNMSSLVKIGLKMG